MLKSKKLITTLMLSAVLLAGAAIPASAVISYDTVPTSGRTVLQGSDKWTRGLYNGNNGWYMSYSYYQNYSYNSYVKASLNGGTNSSQNVVGYTACANRNEPTTYGYAVSCNNAPY